MNPNIFFNVKQILNGILQKFLLIPIGSFDPVSCGRYSITRKKVIIKGTVKCNEKKRFNVALLIQYPSQIYLITNFTKLTAPRWMTLLIFDGLFESRHKRLKILFEPVSRSIVCGLMKFGHNKARDKRIFIWTMRTYIAYIVRVA